MGDGDVESGAWAEPPAPKGRKGRAGSAPAASKGAEAFDSVRDGARYTRLGLRQWQAAGRWGMFAQFLALIASVILVAVVGLAFAGVGGVGLIGTAGLYLGVGALVFWLWSLFNFLLGLRTARRGRDELGYLQRREVDMAFNRVVRGLAFFAVAAAVAVFLGFQAETVTRAGRMPDAVLYALVVGCVAGVLGVWHLSTATMGVLRNLTPNAGKRGRRRTVLLLHLFAVPVVAVYLVGTPLALLNYDVACQELQECKASEFMPVASPAYGAPIRLLSEPPAALYLEGPLLGALVLLAFRFAGYIALRRLSAQLAEADLFLVRHVATHATPPERQAAPS